MEYELKYLLPRESVPAVRRLLDARCLADSRYPENTVCSIYFDTPELRLLDENLNGDRFKSKVRVRWYEQLDADSADSVSMLEVKHRLGSRRSKWRTESPFPSAWLARAPLEDSSLLDVTRLTTRQAAIPPLQLLPYLLVRYRRRRYVEPLTGSRISLDTDIRVSRTNRHRLPCLSRGRFDTVVFEVKNPSGRLPDSLQCVSVFGCRKASFSKYAAGFDAAMNANRPPN